MKIRIVGLLIACFCWPLSAELVEAQEKSAAIAPAEKLPEGWEEIDERLIFLMVRLANVEASLDAVEKQIGTNTTKRVAKTGEAKQAEAGNDLMDRKGGGPMKWSEFYGTTAEKFFYHPTDRHSTYHTVTVLAQKSPQADNKPAEGVPSRQGLPVHQRPPQFDYIYRANANAKERAEADASALKGKVEALNERRQRLEAEQAGLWVEIAFRAVLHYDLDKKPLYRFEPLVAADDATAKQHAETMKAAASFMRLSLSVIDAAQKNQSATFSKIKSEVTDARQKLNDAWLRQGVDVTDRNSTEGKFAALAKRLDDVASNLSDSYEVSVDGDQAKDQLRKETFRGLLQVSLVSYAQIILALDEMAMVMKDDWKIKPDVDKPIQVVNLISVTTPSPTRSLETAPETRIPSTPTPSSLPAGENIKEFVYKSSPQGDLHIFVHYPVGWKASDKRPVMVLIHGGGYVSGDPAGEASRAALFAQSGMVVARPEYRVKQTHKTGPEKCVEDVKSAIRWLRTNASSHGINPQQIVAYGGSTGAHLAACAGTIDGFDAPAENRSISSRPNALVLLNPFLNFRDDMKLATAKGFTKDNALLLSPTLHITKALPPTIIIRGRGNKAHPEAQATEFVTNAKRLNCQIEFYEVDGESNSEESRNKVNAFLGSLGYMSTASVDSYPATVVEPSGPPVEQPSEKMKLDAIIGTWIEKRSDTPLGDRVRTFETNGNYQMALSKKPEVETGKWRRDGQRIYFSDDNKRWFTIRSVDKDSITVLMEGRREYTWERSR